MLARFQTSLSLFLVLGAISTVGNAISITNIHIIGYVLNIACFGSNGIDIINNILLNVMVVDGLGLDRFAGPAEMADFMDMRGPNPASLHTLDWAPFLFFIWDILFFVWDIDDDQILRLFDIHCSAVMLLWLSVSYIMNYSYSIYCANLLISISYI